MSTGRREQFSFCATGTSFASVMAESLFGFTCFLSVIFMKCLNVYYFQRQLLALLRTLLSVLGNTVPVQPVSLVTFIYIRWSLINIKRNEKKSTEWAYNYKLRTDLQNFTSESNNLPLGTLVICQAQSYIFYRNDFKPM